jgi:HSP20 family protein
LHIDLLKNASAFDLRNECQKHKKNLTFNFNKIGGTMTIVKWNKNRQNGTQNPTGFLTDRDLNTLFPSFLNAFSRPAGSRDFIQDFFDDTLNFGTGAIGRNLPAVNISETPNDLVIEVAAPGMKKKDFNIQIDGDQLHISYKKEQKDENTETNHWRREFNYESFERTFTLPTIVESEKIYAAYTDGILKISVPKKEEAKKKPARSIEIQ